MNQIEFLKGRLDEREARYCIGDFEEIDSARGPGWGVRWCGVCGEGTWEGRESTTEDGAADHLDDRHERQFVLAEIAAQRAILELGEGYLGDDAYLMHQLIVTALLQPFADHPDFEEEWKA